MSEEIKKKREYSQAQNKAITCGEIEDCIRKENAVINENHKVTKEEAIQLYETEQASELFGAADRIRKSCCTNSSSVCSIINAKMGKCGENCKYCAQSAHWKTSCQTTSIIQPQESIKFCERALENHVSRISLVTSGRGLSGKDFEAAIENFKAIKEKTKEVVLSKGIQSGMTTKLKQQIQQIQPIQLPVKDMIAILSSFRFIPDRPG